MLQFLEGTVSIVQKGIQDMERGSKPSRRQSSRRSQGKSRKEPQKPCRELQKPKDAERGNATKTSQKSKSPRKVEKRKEFWMLIYFDCFLKIFRDLERGKEKKKLGFFAFVFVDFLFFSKCVIYNRKKASISFHCVESNRTAGMHFSWRHQKFFHHLLS